MGDGRTVIELAGVTLAYGATVALDGVTLGIAAGERVCVLGANGSGKSTLASVICGLLAPDTGTVRICGTTVRTDATGTDFAAYADARRHVGFVFQNPDDQLVTTIVADDVAFGPENLGVAPAEIGTRVERELARVGMGAYAAANPARLSGGQKQRVAIAGALAMEPDVLVLDEPGALLDVRGRRGIMRVMGELHASGTTIVHVTHFMDEALAADRVIVLDGGRIVLDGTPTEVFAHDGLLTNLGLELPFAARLAMRLRRGGVAVPFACDDDRLVAGITALRRTGGTCGTGVSATDLSADDGTDGRGTRRDRTTNDVGTTTGVGAGGGRAGTGGGALDLTGVAGATRGAGEAVAINASHVTYSYTDADGHGHNALADVTFSIARGSHVAVIGHTGSGKSTLLRLLCALAAPDAGTVSVGSVTTATRRGRRQLLGRVGYVMQHPERQLFAETVADDVAFGPKNLGLADADVAARVGDALALVGLADKAAASPFELSGGQQRLCAIAGVVAMRPQVIVLDEPTAGLDPHGRSALRAIIGSIHAAGTTVVEVTHSMDDAATADQVIVLANGTVLADGAPAEVFAASNAELLRTHGLGLPSARMFAHRLADTGAPVAGEPLTMDALVDGILATLPSGEVM